MPKFTINKSRLEMLQMNNERLNMLFNDKANNPKKGFYVPVNSELLDAFEYAILVLNDCAVGLRLIKDFKDAILDLNDLILDYCDVIDGNDEYDSDIEIWINERLNMLFGIKREQKPKQIFNAASYEGATDAIIDIFNLLYFFALGHLNLNDFTEKINEQIEIYEDYELDLFGDDGLIEENEDSDDPD